MHRLLTCNEIICMSMKFTYPSNYSSRTFRSGCCPSRVKTTLYKKRLQPEKQQQLRRKEGVAKLHPHLLRRFSVASLETLARATATTAVAVAAAAARIHPASLRSGHGQRLETLLPVLRPR